MPAAVVTRHCDAVPAWPGGDLFSSTADEYLAALRKAKLPDPLLAKLEALEGETFNKQQFRAKLAQALDKTELAHYEPRYLARLEAPPGVTGPWQVARRERLSAAERCGS